MCLRNVTLLHISTRMAQADISIRQRLDRFGVVLSGLCAVHCLLGLLIVSILGFGGELLLAPAIHRVGLALAVVVAVLTLGLGVIRHRRVGPMIVAGAGITLMALALAVGHGEEEAVLTISGVMVLAVAHIWNLRSAR